MKPVSETIAVLIKYSEYSSACSHETCNPLGYFGNTVLDWEIVKARLWPEQLLLVNHLPNTHFRWFN